MSFRFQKLELNNFRCFEQLSLHLEPDLTLLFAENGGGKSALLHALAVGITAFQSGSPRHLKLDGPRDIRKVTLDQRGRREFAGNCHLAWTAAIGTHSDVAWSLGINASANRRSPKYKQVQTAIEEVRAPGTRWPLFAYYGVDRMGRGKAATKPSSSPDRWEGYAGALNPDQTDAALLTWLLEEILADTVRRQEYQRYQEEKGRGEKAQQQEAEPLEAPEPERFLASAVMDTVAKATPGVAHAWYDPRERSPVVRFENGEVATWLELSDGFHIYLSLVADLARRAIILNQHDGADAPNLIQGVVLIDEIDLHLHPRWQRVVLDGLRLAFPRLQFVATTHSPQVLSSALNRQVRLLENGRIREHQVFVEGRDTNAILRDLMRTDDRDHEGVTLLRELSNAMLDNRALAEDLLSKLTQKWGYHDPELIRAREELEWED